MARRNEEPILLGADRYQLLMVKANNVMYNIHAEINSGSSNAKGVPNYLRHDGWH